jgi:type I restriction enzyme S subunit
LNRRTNETLEGLAQTLFKSWFASSTQAALPKGWRLGKLGELLSVIETGGRPRGGVSDINEGVPSVGAESIVGIGHFDYAKTKFVPREFFQAMNKGHVQDSDVLLYKDGGRPGEFEPHVTMVGDGFPFSEFSINEHVYRLRTEPNLPQSFLYFWLCSDPAMDEMRNRGTGVAIPGLNSTQVRELAVLHPPTDVLTKFDEMVSPLLRRIFANCNESRTIAALRDTLLPKLLSGDLSIRVNGNNQTV